MKIEFSAAAPTAIGLVSVVILVSPQVHAAAIRSAMIPSATFLEDPGIPSTTTITPSTPTLLNTFSEMSPCSNTAGVIHTSTMMIAREFHFLSPRREEKSVTNPKKDDKGSKAPPKAEDAAEIEKKKQIEWERTQRKLQSKGPQKKVTKPQKETKIEEDGKNKKILMNPFVNPVINNALNGGTGQSFNAPSFRKPGNSKTKN
ncbi:hypothetical protein F5050DRAFT_1711773 [Lentinula boryana]|uniref:Uncharacterized protein n=1 Tax=Lentinula boryana TaxID=40481 RepID=A0ABQ8QE44_9AGAR|nr:hypothetical protein F5050DRAFT_1711773 [Lentinula boryana]